MKANFSIEFEDDTIHIRLTNAKGSKCGRTATIGARTYTDGTGEGESIAIHNMGVLSSLAMDLSVIRPKAGEQWMPNGRPCWVVNYEGCIPFVVFKLSDAIEFFNAQ